MHHKITKRKTIEAKDVSPNKPHAGRWTAKQVALLSQRDHATP